MREDLYRPRVKHYKSATVILLTAYDYNNIIGKYYYFIIPYGIIQ